MHTERLPLALATADRRHFRSHHARFVRRPEHVLGRRDIVHIGQLSAGNAHVEVRHHKRDIHHQHVDRDGTGRVRERETRFLRRVRRVHLRELHRHIGRFVLGQRDPFAVRQGRRMVGTETVFPELRQRVRSRNENVHFYADGVAVDPVGVGRQDRR